MATAPTRTRVFPSRTDIGALIVLGAVFLIALVPKLDTDVWWHLWDGRYILDHGSVPTHDFLSFTAVGSPWVDHEWLSEIFLYGLYRAAGLWGTIIGFAVVITGTWILVYIRMLRRAITPFLALFVLLIAFFISVPTWGARPQMLSLLFLAVYALVLDAYRRRPTRRLLVLFPVLMVLWANFHGGWLLGAALLVVTLVGEWLDLQTSRPGALDGTALRNLAVATVVTLIMPIATPNGVAGFIYPLVNVSPGPYTNVLNEWLSVDFHQLIYMVFEGMLLLVLIALSVNRSTVSWTSLLIILAFTYLALSETRNVAVWAVVVSPILASLLQGILESYSRPHSGPERPLRPRMERTVNLALLLFLVLLFPIEILHVATPKALKAAETETYPAAAVTYMNRHNLPPRTLAAYAWGGYLLWRSYPKYRDFIDGRANTLYSTKILFQYLDVTSLAPDWNRVLDRYQVQNVLIEPDLPLAQALDEDRQWHRIYQDGTAVLYTRKPPG